MLVRFQPGEPIPTYMINKLRIAEVIGGILLFFIAAGSYIHSREVAIQTDAEHKTNVVLQSQLQQMKQDFDKQIAARDSQYRQDTQALSDKFDTASKNTAQMVGLLSQLAKLPIQPTVAVPPATKENQNPTPIITASVADLPALAVYSQSCEACKLDRDKAAADLADRTKQMGLAQQQIDNLRNENALLLKASHGTFWSNAKRAFKWLVIGGTFGYVAGHKF